MSNSIKVGSKWSGKTAASAIGTVGIVNNSDDTILLTPTKDAYKVKEILSKEEFEELVANVHPGQKVKGKNTTNRNIAMALQNQFNKQSKSNSRGTKKSISVTARSPSPAARSPSLTTTRRKPTVAPSRKRPQVAPKRETSLERNLRLVAESQTPTDVASSLHNNMSNVITKMTVPELKVALNTRGLSIKGLKAELVKRLLNALKNNA